MIRRVATLLIAFALAMTLPRAAAAEEVVMGLSQSSVSITTNFAGSDILIFGAIKRETAIPEEELDVIVTVAGPSAPVTVRRKDRMLGIWVNTEAVQIDSAPSFYAVAATGKLGEVLSQTEDLRHRISIPLAIRSVGAPDAVGDAQRFTEALIRIHSAKGLYEQLDDSVDLQEQTLFRSSIRLPANLTEGAYRTRIFLARGGEVVAKYETIIDVRKVGLERLLYTMAHRQPVLYGLMALALAIAAGWGASAFFRVVLRQG
ncbi:MAG: TIGR02186 family protein [Rhodobacterales bacterium]|nr:TIGR02186 family protein [Rhodobacterales bacterium]MDX5391459.1 TIGR02186 family protein [Rhodobacterales bacterium]MDX5491159.1 TIGR02186 family protein [Rhodobacterales bacterium]